VAFFNAHSKTFHGTIPFYSREAIYRNMTAAYAFTNQMKSTHVLKSTKYFYE